MNNLKPTSSLKSSLDISMARVNLEISQEEYKNPQLLYEKAYQWYAAGLFKTVGDAQAHARLVLERDRGTPMLPEIHEMFIERDCVVKAWEKLREKEAAASAAEQEIHALNEQRNSVAALLKNERDVLASIPEQVAQLGNYLPNLHHGSTPLRSRMSGLIYRHHCEIFEKHLRDVVIPDLEAQLVEVERKITEFYESRKLKQPTRLS